MNPGRYFMPNMGMMPNSMMNNNGFVQRNNLFSRIANGIKGFNWSGLINGASKTLNVVNQTIPLIRQTRPMINNVRNMINLAKAFRKETSNNKYIAVKDKSLKKEVIDSDNYPNFFV